MNYLANLWHSVWGLTAPRIAALEARIAEFEKKAAEAFRVRSEAQKKRKTKTDTGATQ